MQQEHTICDFSDSNSWVILSPIEQSIRRKIESIGTPLKDWDINIYRGVLTGYNDAFIISTEKRDEILANCQTEGERQKTAELIRPILRGRDIKRYEYEWADLWIIATFPSRHYDIESYPAVKNYLQSIGIKRLEQTGKTHIVNGKKVKARKKTSNEWFETQDSISYWDRFLLQIDRTMCLPHHLTKQNKCVLCSLKTLLNQLTQLSLATIFVTKVIIIIRINNL